MKVIYNDPVYGQQEREYTKEIHGDNYKELAKEFSSHISGGKILDEEPVELAEETIEEQTAEEPVEKPTKAKRLK